MKYSTSTDLVVSNQRLLIAMTEEWKSTADQINGVMRLVSQRDLTSSYLSLVAMALTFLCWIALPQPAYRDNEFLVIFFERWLSVSIDPMRVKEAVLHSNFLFSLKPFL